MRSFALYIRQCRHLAQGIQLEKPLWLLIKLMPKACSGIFDGNFVQGEIGAFLVEGDPRSLRERTEPVRNDRSQQIDSVVLHNVLVIGVDSVGMDPVLVYDCTTHHADNRVSCRPSLGASSAIDGATR